MLGRLIAMSLAQRLLVLVLTVMMVLAGAQAVGALSIDAFPDVSSTQVKIIMKAPGMTPEEVESRIVAPIEQELLGIPQQAVLRSQSKYAIADITLNFQEGTDMYWARQQAAERLAAVLKDLPESASGGLAPITTPLGDVFMFTIEGPLSLMEKRTLLEWTIRPQLRNIPGVADVNSLGGAVRSFEVVPDLAALAARKVSLSQLEQALQANNRSDGAGRLASGEESFLIRSDASVRTLADVAAISITSHHGMAVTVGQVAQVRIGALTRYGTVTQNGQGEAVQGLVLAMRGANALQVVDQVRQRLDEIGKSLPAGTSISTFYDRGHLVERAVQTVGKALLEATVLVVVLLYVFLGNVRAAVVVACILPLSALGTFLLMQQFGLSANLMSLGGLAIAIGMLVDAAVVVVENIEAHSNKAQSGMSWLHVIYRAVREVAVPVTAGMVVIMVVFIPLLTLQGLEGKMFAPVAMTIIFALGASLLLSLTVIPVLSSFLLKAQHGPAPRIVVWLESVYQKLLQRALGHERLVVGSAAAALVLALGLFTVVGKSFMPVLEEGDLIMQSEKLPSVSLEQSTAQDLAIQRRILQQVPEVTRIVARLGTDELGLDPMGPNESDSFLVLKPRAEWRSPDKEDLVDALRKATADFPGINFSFTQPIEMRTSEMLSGVRGDLALKIFGPDTQKLGELAEQVVGVLQAIPGSEDVLTVKNEGVQYMQVDIDRVAAGRLGLSAEQVQNDLRTMIEGRNAGIVIDNAQRLPLLLRGGDATRMSPELFQQLRLPLADGQAVPLSQLATLRMVDGPVKVERENSSRLSVVRANVRGRDLVGFVEEAKAAVAQKVKLPAGYRLSWGGQFENQQRAAARLALVVPAALALIFLLLFTTLGSVRQSILVFVNIPFALIGGVVALAVTGEYLSVPASVGFIALMGIAVLNGLVMITCFNQMAARGVPLAQVVVQGALRRLRPVLMTASITGLGLVPLLLASGPGSEIQKPLAIVVIGGLLSATLLTLILLPLLFRRFGVPGNPKTDTV
ncbi:CusA/CzcA family heavy metal efflux RND transporter [Pseudoduganella sp. DS3]|uniref:CusA/CzcA family heavy metal efflux RND transporter n=1 Tax=Pseudoduganella guangdongensis TaxID=2692179 RepID=A0A6N9HBL8_9BURK|nr:CusA/CzcA family heavy metal efflux RND transporter [Pseudoduganella guangdongensis]MYN00850.1 CusA/CzcA family heavy metal efflux RND transporter [Pseudoduganella guangdongensis]